MKVAMYYSQADVRIEEMPTPKINEDEALVEMHACGICGSDLMEWYLKSRAPLVLGHEPSGKIVKKGSKVKNFDVGDRVFVHHHVACLTCHYCQHGDYTLCEQFHNTHLDPGGFAEYFIVPKENLQLDTLKIPDNISFEEATFIEPIGCCLRALKKCNVQAKDSIAIIGAGAIGILHVALAKIFEVEKIFASDLIDFRLEMAKSFGANFVVNPEKGENLRSVVMAETDGIGADVVIVTAPSLSAYKTGISICRKGGKLCVFAPVKPSEYLQINPNELFFSEMQIIPSYSTSHLETRMALDLLKSEKIKVKKLITHHFRLLEAAEAFKTAAENRKSLKIIILNR